MRPDISRAGIGPTRNCRSAIYEHLVQTLSQIIPEPFKPVGNIESIKILQIDGLHGLNSPSETSGIGGGGSGNLSDQVMNSAMKYCTHFAFVDAPMEGTGLPLKNLGSADGTSCRIFLPGPSPPRTTIEEGVTHVPVR